MDMIFITIFIYLTLLIGLGALVSLVALFPPLRRWAYQTKKRRIFLVVLLGGLPFILVYLVVGMPLVRFNAFLACNEIGQFDGANHCGDREAQELGYANSYALEEAVYQEVWRRMMIPSLSKNPCYAENSRLCTFLDGSGIAIGSSGLLLIVACIPGLVAGFLVWGWTRPLKSKPDELVAGT
jgi:hypothetical protein